jgi:hypothetical protein
MTVSRFRSILYTVAAIVSLTGLADATYLAVQALTGATRLRRIARLFPCAGQLLCEGWWNSASCVRHAGLLQRIQLRHVRGFRLCARANVCFSF